MTVEPSPISPATEEKINPFARIAGVFVSPSATFQSIARRPDIVVPLIVFLLLSVVAGAMIATRVDFASLAHETIGANADMQRQMTPERLERTEKMAAGSMRIMTYASPVLSLLALAIYSGLALIGFRMFGGEGTYKQAFSITVYAWYPRLVQGLLGMAVLLSKKSVGIFDLQSPLRSNLAFLFDPKTQPLQAALALRFDVFIIWSIVLLTLGFAAMSRMSRAKSAAVVVGLWVVATLLMAIGPAIQAARMS